MDYQRHLALDGLKDEADGLGVLAGLGETPALPGQKGANVQTYEAVSCAGCGKLIRRPKPALPFSYCRTCRGRK
jgi:hypothetical protein